MPLDLCPLPAWMLLSGAWSLRSRRLGGREVHALDEDTAQRPPAENRAELLRVRDRTVLTPETDDCLDLRFRDAGQFEQLTAIGDIEPDPVLHAGAPSVCEPPPGTLRDSWESLQKVTRRTGGPHRPDSR